MEHSAKCHLIVALKEKRSVTRLSVSAGFAHSLNLIEASLDWNHKVPLQSRWQVNRRHHAARTPTAKLNRRDFKRHEPRVAAQSFPLLLGQCSRSATGKHEQFLSILVV